MSESHSDKQTGMQIDNERFDWSATEGEILRQRLKAGASHTAMRRRGKVTVGLLAQLTGDSVATIRRLAKVPVADGGIPGVCQVAEGKHRVFIRQPALERWVQRRRKKLKARAFRRENVKWRSIRHPPKPSDEPAFDLLLSRELLHAIDWVSVRVEVAEKLNREEATKILHVAEPLVEWLSIVRDRAKG